MLISRRRTLRTVRDLFAINAAMLLLVRCAATAGASSALVTAVDGAETVVNAFLIEAPLISAAFPTVLPASQWRGYREPPEAPPPAAGTWGDHPPLPSLLAQATAERQAGGTMQGVIGILDSDPSDVLAMALARLGRAMQNGNPQ